MVRERFFLYFDWEMMTYWAVIAVAHALDYHRESQERAVTAAQLETRLAEAQLQALQRQLHPHFLFNTLHTISALMHRNIEAADAMLARLSDLLRMTLDQLGTQVVTLKEELDFVEKYLEIEHTRFGDRLQVRIDAEPGTLDASVPNFILQPLVENALRHGIGPKLGGGTVEVTTRRVGDRLLPGGARRRPRRASREAERLQHGRRAGQHPVAARAPVWVRAPVRVRGARRPAGWR